MIKYYILLALLCGSSAGAAGITYAGRADCRVAEQARVAGQVAYWSGACKEGYASGPGALQWSKDGKATERYEGTLSRGVPEGAGIAQWADGSRYEGNYQDGMLHGPAVVMFKEGDKLEASFEQDKPVGNVKVLYGGGDRYEGGWKNGPEGSGTRVFALGGSYRGQWREGKPFGDGEILYPNGQVLKAHFNGSFQMTVPAEKLAVAQPYVLKRKDPPTGSAIHSAIGRGYIAPPEKSYAQLTPEQQQQVKSNYPILQDDDAPPYPEKGMQEPSYFMSRLISRGDVVGQFHAHVSVDELGVAKSVAMLESPDGESGKLVALMLMQVKYTPGRCAGQPCAMAVPFIFELSYTK